MRWPASREELIEAQLELARAKPEDWRVPGNLECVAGCFSCSARGKTGVGDAGDPLWAAAVLVCGRRIEAEAGVAGEAGAAFEPGLLALREGPILEKAVLELGRAAPVLLVNATGRDHPRRAGLAVHLGAVLGLPTVGVTHRPLLARGEWPPDEAGAAAPLDVDGELVGYWLRTRARRRPLAVHAGWRTDADTALAVVRATARGLRTPVPVREARRLARTRRARHVCSGGEAGRRRA